MAAVQAVFANAQRRPGLNPGDTRTGHYSSRSSTALNEGRGLNPGDTKSAVSISGEVTAIALNEGRGLNPGDTAHRIPLVVTELYRFAQRRPGSEPRRHLASRCRRAAECRLAALNEGRGLNPGDTTWIAPGPRIDSA